jgi:hypothetical protein
MEALEIERQTDQAPLESLRQDSTLVGIWKQEKKAEARLESGRVQSQVSAALSAIRCAACAKMKSIS